MLLPLVVFDYTVITIDRALQGPCCGAVDSSHTMAKVLLPSGEFAGSSVVCSLSLYLPTFIPYLCPLTETSYRTVHVQLVNKFCVLLVMF